MHSCSTILITGTSFLITLLSISFLTHLLQAFTFHTCASPHLFPPHVSLFMSTNNCPFQTCFPTPVYIFHPYSPFQKPSLHTCSCTGPTQMISRPATPHLLLPNLPPTHLFPMPNYPHNLPLSSRHLRQDRGTQISRIC